ncbi:hypothetical protein HK101_008750 [Irineochytrium annulatum]|nr:hypothetical protein HK101_008750 [Irineochytrium annulatum]
MTLMVSKPTSADAGSDDEVRSREASNAPDEEDEESRLEERPRRGHGSEELFAQKDDKKKRRKKSKAPVQPVQDEEDGGKEERRNRRARSQRRKGGDEEAEDGGGRDEDGGRKKSRTRSQRRNEAEENDGRGAKGSGATHLAAGHAPLKLSESILNLQQENDYLKAHLTGLRNNEREVWGREAMQSERIRELITEVELERRERDIAVLENRELKGKIAALKRQVLKEAGKVAMIPKIIPSKQPTTLEGNLNLRASFQQRLLLEREKYTKLQDENRELMTKLKGLEGAISRKAVNEKPNAHRVNEVLYWKKKIREVETEKAKLEEKLGNMARKLERADQEREKILQNLEATKSLLSQYLARSDTLLGLTAANPTAFAQTTDNSIFDFLELNLKPTANKSGTALRKHVASVTTALVTARKLKGRTPPSAPLTRDSSRTSLRALLQRGSSFTDGLRIPDVVEPKRSSVVSRAAAVPAPSKRVSVAASRASRTSQRSRQAPPPPPPPEPEEEDDDDEEEEDGEEEEEHAAEEVQEEVVESTSSSGMSSEDSLSSEASAPAVEENIKPVEAPPRATSKEMRSSNSQRSIRSEKKPKKKVATPTGTDSEEFVVKFEARE